MTAVKAEPNPENLLPTPREPVSKGANIESNEDVHNRQVLAHKLINCVKGTPSGEKEMQMRNIESFLLKPGQISSARDAATSSVKREKKQEGAARKEAPGPDRITASVPVSVPVSVPAPKSAGPTKRPAQESPDKPLKKRELNEKFKQLPNFAEVDKGERRLENPGPYTPIDKLLYETRGEDSESLFQDLEQQSERSFCSQAASWSLEEWIGQGQQLLDTHTRLIGRLVQHRIELSLKLQVITSAVNDRAAALNEQGLLVDQKLAKIKTLGEEILHII